MWCRLSLLVLLLLVLLRVRNSSRGFGLMEPKEFLLHPLFSPRLEAGLIDHHELALNCFLIAGPGYRCCCCRYSQRGCGVVWRFGVSVLLPGDVPGTATHVLQKEGIKNSFYFRVHPNIF